MEHLSLSLSLSLGLVNSTGRNGIFFFKLYHIWCQIEELSSHNEITEDNKQVHSITRSTEIYRDIRRIQKWVLISFYLKLATYSVFGEREREREREKLSVWFDI
ncbi:hypothetical protein CsSME_00024636 [Camellia sinensis var. sinensis]